MNRLHSLFLLFLGIPAILFANMASPTQPGDPLGEPSPFLDSIRVLHEDLEIDMRPCASGSPVRITASYSLFNSGREEDLDLVFIAGRLHDSGRGMTIRLDGHPITGRLADTLFMPESWGLPRYTPGFEDFDIPYEVYYQTPLEYYSGDFGTVPATAPPLNSAVLFTLRLEPGEHVITVDYLAMPSSIADYSFSIYNWQLGYVLAPASEWGGFDSLDITVLLPSGWEARSYPEMEEWGNSLRGAWSGVPADAVALITRHQLSGFEQWFVGLEDTLFTICLLLSILLPLLIGIRQGRLLAVQGKSVYKGVVPLLFQIGIIELLLCLLLSGNQSAVSAIYGNQELPSYSFLVFIGIVFTALAGTILSPLALWISMRIVRARLKTQRYANREQDSSP